MWERGAITKPAAPELPDLRRRGFGDVCLGTLTAKAKARDEAREKRFASYMQAAIDDPEKFSPVVKVPIVDASLVGKKIEVRWTVGDGAGGSYLHCFEGTNR